MKLPKVAVIGTGPSAVPCVANCIKFGIRPTIFDTSLGGIDLDQEETVALKIRNENDNQFGRKSWLGSVLPYAQHQYSRLVYSEVEPVSSYTFGGLSRVWGASVSFNSDILDCAKEIQPSNVDFALIQVILPIIESNEESTSLVQHSSCTALKKRIKLNKFEWEVIDSKLAIETLIANENYCRLCSLCINGCSYDSIWNSGFIFRRYIKQNQIEYRGGSFVEKFREVESSLEISIISGSGERNIETFDYVFLATGAISTAEILLRSNFVSSVTIQDSSTAFSLLFPFIPRQSKSLPNHSLSQFWIRNKSEGTTFQVYAPSRLLTDRITNALPKILRHKFIIGFITDYAFPMISYLPSSKSGKIYIEEVAGEYLVQHLDEDNARKNHLKALLRFSFKMLKSGVIFPYFSAKIPPPGAGYHFGASFPHGGGTNSLGQLDNVSLLSIVDSSVLPKIESGSIAPTVMLNSARISREVLENIFKL